MLAVDFLYSPSSATCRMNMEIAEPTLTFLPIDKVDSFQNQAVTIKLYNSSKMEKCSCDIELSLSVKEEPSISDTIVFTVTKPGE